MESAKLLAGATPFFYPGGNTGCLLVHGLTGTPYEVRWLGQYLNAQDCTVYAPRLAGHGTSPRRLAQTTWPEWYHDTLAGYELLRRQCDHVFVAGLSMGGALSLLLAAREAVAGVVAMAAPHRIGPCRGWQGFLLPLLSLLAPYRPKNTPPEIEAAFQQRVMAEQRARGEEAAGHPSYPVWPTRAVVQFCRLSQAMRQELPRITAPALLIYSQADGVVSPEDMRLNVEAIGSRAKETLVLQHSRHVVTEDVEREVVFKRVGDFIKKHSVSAG